MLVDVVLIITGLTILIGGAEGLVGGASSLAKKLRISHLIIGLTVVSFGTSAPELAVNLLSAVDGSTDLALGNVVGSNIANILLVLGVSAILVPLSVKESTVWREIPLALLGVVLLFIMGNDTFFDSTNINAITHTDGVILLALMVMFIYYIYRLVKTHRADVAEITMVEEEMRDYSILSSIGLFLVGLAGLFIGGKLLVSGASNIALDAGLSEALVGLTIVAIGTSLPELVTSTVAARKGHADIAIGNIVGSNIFNIFFVIGSTSTLTALPVSKALDVDIFVSIVASLLLFAFMFVGGKHRLARWQGCLFVTMYIAYITFLIQRG